MSPEIAIERVKQLPADLDMELVPASVGEAFAPIQWLKEQWRDGSNQFSQPGEAFYVARIDGRLVGVCGLNRDPYVKESSSGRLRRLYVLPDFRRKGIGRRLVLCALEEARPHFAVVNLRTFDDESAAFFEAIGFQKVENNEGLTHRKAIA
jgi:N-acetylglutamate synthase-like GNAT family acetyltransferase